ncbi:hypothetical protein PVK06_010344 [Gossypium arboreum]|uniref:RNase H type-1 domain-containing protein n=1 Tax=Gossypium arboreum TaxID=29729 RepID=A0ABR0Q707_GOSAR|nr:hypothetical protein PVK06_010344 [Gossypium arboreum]
MASDRTVEGVSSTVKESRDLLDQDWQIELKHIFSESNFAADFMAKMAVSLAVGLHVHIKPPMSILPGLDHDTMNCSKKSVHCSYTRFQLFTNLFCKRTYHFQLASVCTKDHDVIVHNDGMHSYKLK